MKIEDSFVMFRNSIISDLCTAQISNSILNTQYSILNTQYSKLETRNPKPETRNSKLETRNSKLYLNSIINSVKLFDDGSSIFLRIR